MATPNLVTFSDWQQKTNASLMSCAEELLEKLEDTSDLLSEIDEKYIRTDTDTDVSDDRKSSMIQRFHAGLDSARNLVNVLKREKWRLNKREMSVELRLGELEDYKSHLKKDMSSLNQTVEVLSLRVVQLENQLVEAQEVQESLEADLQEHKNSLQDANDRNIQLYTENEDLKKALQTATTSTTSAQKTSGTGTGTLLQKENQRLKDEVSMLSQENSKLKDMVRHAEAMASPVPPRKEALGPPGEASARRAEAQSSPPLAATAGESRREKDDNLSKLTKEFLDELTSLELRENGAGGRGDGGDASGVSAAESSSSSSSSSSTKKLPSADV
ncbi:uncharacterized protein LOC143296041 [Babylonia areolata]|uniref:uncharacterized protein LOC143296041 n=1 Tax=Babylonia areolata TaxID=304850 RepID=UPI003FCF1E55